MIDQLSLGEVADRRSGTYSGGQRRRLDLGASLVGGPRLLLLDEPTTGLDPVSRREVWHAVRGLAASGTDILLTTHYLDEADELADHVVVIDHGRAIAAGTVERTEGQRWPGRHRGDGDRAGRGRCGRADPRAGHDEPSQVLMLAGGASRALAPGGPAELAAVISCLQEAAIGVDEIGLRRPTLDEAFLTLTDETCMPATAGPTNRSAR